MLGENLEARYYTDPDVFQEEKRRVFQATWQVVAPLSAFADKGDYVAVDIAGTKILLSGMNPARFGRFAIFVGTAVRRF